MAKAIRTNTRERRRLQRALNGYQKDKHAEKDKAQRRYHFSEDSKEMRQQALKLFKEYMEEEKGIPSDDSVGRGCPAPSLSLWKEHMRWYANSAKGKLRDRPTVSSTVNHAERVFAAFTEATETQITLDDRCEIYTFIRKTMLDDGEVANVKRQKYNFTVKNFLHLHHSNWTLDDPVFIHGRVKAQMTFLYQGGLFSGARLGAYVPEPSQALIKGIKYRDVELLLMPIPGLGPEHWLADSRLSQRYVKNNKDPENSIYSNVMGDDQRLPFAATMLMLTFAFADEALWGFNSPDDLWEQSLPLDPAGQPEPVPLRWRDEVLHKPICRAVTMDGVDPLRAFDKVSFSKFHISLVRNAGYSETPTYHSIRRLVGKELNKRYKPEERSQVLNQDPSVYGRDYIAHTSSASVKDAVLGEEARTDLLSYFQSFDQFLVHGLPCHLPSERERDILADPELVNQRDQIAKKMCEDSNPEELQAMKTTLKSKENSLKKRALDQYQKEWVENYRKSTILSRGKGRREPPQKSWRSHTLGKIIPERARLAKSMPYVRQISHQEKLAVLKDMIAYVTRDYRVVYLPNEEPIDDLCPVPGCQQRMSKLQKLERSKHVHRCRRIEFAQNHQCKPDAVHYCYLDCFTWFLGGEVWDLHCQQHLESLSTLYCEVFTYCNTMVRPAYCPQCLGNERLKPSERLRPFSRSAELRNHLEKHHAQESVCCPSFCGHVFTSNDDKGFHWSDVHGVNKNIWKKVALPTRDGVSIQSHSLSLQSTKTSQHVPKENVPVSHASKGLHAPIRRQTTQNTEGPETDVNEPFMKRESTFHIDRDPMYMDFETTTSYSMHLAVISSSSNSHQPSLDLIPIDPQILNEQCTGSAHGDPQNVEPIIEECYQTDQITLSNDEAWRSSPNDTNSLSTAFDSEKSRSSCKAGNDLTTLVNTNTGVDGTSVPALSSVAAMTRSRTRAQNQKVLAPGYPDQVCSSPFRGGPFTREESRFLKQLMNRKLSRREIFAQFLERFKKRTLASLRSHWSEFHNSPKASTKSRPRRSCRLN